MPTALLPGRGVVEVTGADRVAFLQGLVSNDVSRVAPGRATWAALLTPQGKWLADFFVLAEGERLLLDCARDQAGLLVGTLSRYRLRAKVALRDASAEFAVHAAWGGAGMPEAARGAPDPGLAKGALAAPDPGLPEGALAAPDPGLAQGALAAPDPGLPKGALAAPDPRLPEAGWRVLAAAPLPADAGEAAYDLHRLALGLPDGARDLDPGKSVLLEGGFDELNGISWTKGCYMGQELTARTRYRGLLKKRLFPVAVAGPLPAPGTPVTREGAEAGEMRSGRAGRGLALLRIEAVAAGGPLACGAAVLTPRIPAWMKLPERESA